MIKYELMSPDPISSSIAGQRTKPEDYKARIIIRHK
jgi:hypothetical protein